MAKFHLPVITGAADVAPGLASARALGEAGTTLVDGQARNIRYLRVSLTDRCNYPCRLSRWRCRRSQT